MSNYEYRRLAYVSPQYYTPIQEPPLDFSQSIRMGTGTSRVASYGVGVRPPPVNASFDYTKINGKSLDDAVKSSNQPFYHSRGNIKTPYGNARGRKGSL